MVVGSRSACHDGRTCDQLIRRSAQIGCHMFPMRREGARAEPVPYIQDDSVLEWEQRCVLGSVMHFCTRKERTPMSSSAEVCARRQASRHLDLHWVQLNRTHVPSVPTPSGLAILVIYSKMSLN